MNETKIIPNEEEQKIEDIMELENLIRNWKYDINTKHAERHWNKITKKMNVMLRTKYENKK